MRAHAGMLLALILTALCGAQGPNAAPKQMALELLVFDGCPNSPKMAANLTAALKTMGLPAVFKKVDLRNLPKHDPRLGYGAPTILLNGQDLFGLKRNRTASSLSCRLYATGVPSAQTIAARLKIKGVNAYLRAAKVSGFDISR